jgi:hypothetical protein
MSTCENFLSQKKMFFLINTLSDDDRQVESL